MPSPLKRRPRAEFEASAMTLETLGLGAIAGLRSMAAPALLSRAVRRGDLGGLRDTPLATLGQPKVSAALQLLMTAEMAADKTPFIPSRTSTPALLGRALSGALAGAALFANAERHPAPGAMLGALAAVAGAHAGEKLRARGAEKLGVPDPVLGLVEDGVVLFGGTRLLRRT